MSLRKVTPKRAAINRAAHDWRYAKCYEIGQCELTGSRKLNHLCLHEIPRSDRVHAYTEPCAVLCLSNEPLDGGKSAHQIVDSWPKAKQLALLLAVREEDYDLATYNMLATSQVTDDDVAAYRDEVQRELGKFQPDFPMWG